MMQRDLFTPLLFHWVLAVVEAKRCSRNPRDADEQLRHYVTEIAKRQSFAPFRFMTNGYTTHFWEAGLANPRLVGLRPLGTRREQMAEFQGGDEQEAPWHGYPVYPHVKGLAPPNRGGDRCRPAKEVFRKMHSAGLITRVQRTRLSKGRHV